MRRFLSGTFWCVAVVAVLSGAGWPVASAQRREQPKTILIAPPVQWEASLLSFKPAQQHTATDLSRLTGGITFGIQPEEVNARLPAPLPGLAWTDLPAADEFAEDVRYFWTRLEGAGSLAEGITQCAGRDSHVVLLFHKRSLFRISYRLVPDAACPSTADTAEGVFGRYLAIGREVALSVHYRNRAIEVVDIMDPTVGYLIPTRWQPRGR